MGNNRLNGQIEAENSNMPQATDGGWWKKNGAPSPVCTLE
jgi:hypothetical protein